MNEVLKISKQLKKNQRLINEERDCIEVKKTLPFYSIYGMMHQKAIDIEKSEAKIKKLLNKRHTLLENMQMAARKELNVLSQQQQLNAA